ncbi:MAG: putative rane protein [Herbinix sp.]|jgi:transporter family-2 protein|nr:putative rane protein [Herbinix sp.]
MLFFYLLLSIIAGATVVAARMINSNLAGKIGTFQGTLINYVTGLIFSILFLWISKEQFSLFSNSNSQVPLWAYFGGLVGVAVVVLSNYLTPRISSFTITLLIFIGQLFAGIIIDYIVLQEFSIGKLIGGILVLTGLAYNLRIDKKEVSIL